ncbi:MAG: nitrile hydratase accessory protein [Rhodospirillales bacterium]
MSLVDNLSLDPETALPRSNGELVFKEPWESRAFGMAAALADLGVFEWTDFQAGLIAAIADYEPSDEEPEAYAYYEHWLATLEALVVERGLVAVQDIDELVADYSQRPDGHDHGEGHHHEH